MASTDTTSSTADDHKRTVDEAFLNRLKSLVERLRLDNATLKKSLDIERSGVRGLKAQHEAAIRNLKTEYKKKEEFLEKQLRVTPKTEKCEDHRLADCKRLTVEIQSLKAANKGLQEKVKVHYNIIFIVLRLLSYQPYLFHSAYSKSNFFLHILK